MNVFFAREILSLTREMFGIQAEAYHLLKLKLNR